MKNIKFAIFVLFLTFVFCPKAHTQMLSAEQIYQYARVKNRRALFFVRQYLDVEDSQGNTAVCLAVKNNDVEAAHELIQRGANSSPSCLSRVQRTAEHNPTFLGMGATGWGVTGLVVAGIGIGAASGGGGGGGGSDNPKISYNNYNENKLIVVEATDSSKDVIGLEYLSNTGNKIGNVTDLYNAYFNINNTTSDLDENFDINANSINPEKNSLYGGTSVYGLKNTEGAAYNVYVDGNAANPGGTLSANINVTSEKNENTSNLIANMYGIYAKEDIETIKKINADNLNVLSTVNVFFNPAVNVAGSGAYLPDVTMYGIKSAEGNATNSKNSEINIKVNDNKNISAYMYGVDAANIAANSGVVTLKNTRGSVYGLRGASTKNSGSIYAETSNANGAYGIYTLGTVDNSEGTIEVKASSGVGAAYGVYMDSEIDLTTLGTITVTNNTSTGKTVGVHFANKEITLNSAISSYITDKITISGGGIGYLFEGGNDTTINNDIELSGGLSASNVVNTGTVNGASRGINASESVINSGTITASNKILNYLNTYGIYSAKTATNSGNISVEEENTNNRESSTVNVYGIYAGNEVNTTNSNSINVTSSGRYIYVYGIYAENKVDNKNKITVNKTGTNNRGAFGIYVSADTGTLDNKNAEVTVTNTNATGGNTYGLYAKGGIDNSGSTISVTRSGGGNSTSGAYGLYSHQSINNSNAKITVKNQGSYGSAYGLYVYSTSEDVLINNSGAVINVENSATNYLSYGIYANNEGISVDNTGGTITVKATSTSSTSQTNTAYGIYTKGSIDLTKMGTISASNSSSFGSSVGVHFESGELTLNNANKSYVDKITVEGNQACYLFEGAEGLDTEGNYKTQITNEINQSGGLNAGLRAGKIINTGIINGRSHGVYGNYINNSGSISAFGYGIYATNSTLADEDTVINTGTVYVQNSVATTGDRIVGIYASNSNIDNQGTVNVYTTTSIPTYGIYTNKSIALDKVGTINVKNDSGNAIGIHFESGEMNIDQEQYNNLNINVTGDNRYLFEGGLKTTITTSAVISEGLKGYNITNSGTINGGRYGVYSQGNSSNKGNVINSGTINASNYGVYLNNSGLVNENTGIINVEGIGDIKGVYAMSSTITNEGAINVNKTGSTGKDTTNGVYLNASTLNNKGTITVNKIGDIYYAIYATNGSQVTNSGTITINVAGSLPYSCEGNACKTETTQEKQFIYLDSTSQYINAGLMMSPSAINLNQSFGAGSVKLAKGGSFNTPSLSGNLYVDNNVVSEGFNDSYAIADAIISDDASDLHLISESAMFDATLEGQDVVMKKKAFSDVIKNDSIADFLEQNYSDSNNEPLFKLLKSEQNVGSLNNLVDDLTGTDTFSRFTFEDLATVHDLNYDINNKLFENKEDYFQTTGNFGLFSFNKKAEPSSRYALYSTKNGNNSYGFSIAFADRKDNLKYKNNTARKNQTVYISVPMGRDYNGYKLISTPIFGYSYGSYEREGYSGKTYNGKVEKRIFGVTNEVRYPLDLGSWNISPTAEFNMLGYKFNGKEDAQLYSLNIPKQSSYSVESGIGFNIAKKQKFSKNQTLTMNAGLMFYHEFADPYEIKLQMNDMTGSFKTKDDRRKNNRASLRTGLEYKLGDDLSLDALFATQIDGLTNTNASLNFKFNM